MIILIVCKKVVSQCFNFEVSQNIEVKFSQSKRKMDVVQEAVFLVEVSRWT